MKRIWYLSVAALMLGLAVGAWAQDVSLGDYARKQREQAKPASPTTKVFTNDDIASAPPPSVSTPPADNAKDKDAKASAKGDKKDATKAEEMAKAADEFKQRVADQKAKIAEIQRNIEVSNREYKLRTIDWYTQAGNALLDPKKFKDQGDAHDKEIADLQKQLADANAELEKIREEIRAAGLSSSTGD